jgi:hypothetical protein
VKGTASGFAFTWKIPTLAQLASVKCASSCERAFYFDVQYTADVGCRTNGLNLGFFSIPGAGGGDPSASANLAIHLATDDGTFAADNPVSFTLAATRLSLRTIKVSLERVDTAPSSGTSSTTPVTSGVSLSLSGKAGSSYQTPVVSGDCGENCVSYQAGSFTPASSLVAGPYIFYQIRAETIDETTSGTAFSTISRLFRVELAGSDVSSLTVVGPTGSARFGVKFNVAISTTNLPGRAISIAILADNGRGGGDPVTNGVVWESGSTFTSVDATGTHIKTMGVTLGEAAGRGYFYVEARTTETSAPVKVGRSSVFQLSDAECAQCCLQGGSGCEGAPGDATPFPYATTCCAVDQVCCSVDGSGDAGSFRCCSASTSQCGLLPDPVGSTTHSCSPKGPASSSGEDEGAGLSEETITIIAAAAGGCCLCLLLCLVLACCGGLTFFTEKSTKKGREGVSGGTMGTLGGQQPMTTFGTGFAGGGGVGVGGGGGGGGGGTGVAYPNTTFTSSPYDQGAYGYGGGMQQQQQL